MCVSLPCWNVPAEALKNTAEPHVALFPVSTISHGPDDDDEDAVQAGVSSKKSPPPCCPALLLVSRTVPWNVSCSTLSRNMPPPEISATLPMKPQDVTLSSDFSPTWIAPPVGAEFVAITDVCTTTWLDEPRKHPPPELFAMLYPISLSVTTNALVVSE